MSPIQEYNSLKKECVELGIEVPKGMKLPELKKLISETLGVDIDETPKQQKEVKNPLDFKAVVVNGCLIEPNTVYQIESKTPDASAPEVYRDPRYNSSKERMPGVGNTLYLTQSDTGFFDASTVFNQDERIKNNWTERAKKADELYQAFAAPLKTQIFDIEKIRNSTDDEFFDKHYESRRFAVTIAEGLQFNTSIPIERFKLYIAIIEGALSMKGKRDEDEKKLGLKDETDNFHKDAQYSYVSISKRKTKLQEVAKLETETLYKFIDLLRKDKQTLINVLKYINVPAIDSMNDLDLQTLYKKNIETSRDKLKYLSETFTEIDKKDSKFKEKIDIIEKLKTKLGKELVVKNGSNFYYGDTSLGSNYKSVAESLLKPEFLSIYRTFLQKFDE